MKPTLKNLLLTFFVLIAVVSFGQQDCKVLKEEISAKYTGDCKKGLAHGQGYAQGTDTYNGQFRKGLPDGKGTYTWANGDIYEGEWHAGYRDGFGTFTFSTGTKDSVMVGMWNDDTYSGPKIEKPKVISVNGVDSYSFRRLGDGDQVTVNIFMNGSRNANLENFSMISNSGSNFDTGQSVGYEHINFPFICKISYTSWNKMQTSQQRVRFEFEISQPGNWELILHN